MRLKTLGVIATTAIVFFTVFYWLSDAPRRESIGAEHEAELLEYGEVIFSNDTAEPAAAGCANCHGPEGMGGEPGAQVVGPNLHSRSLFEKLRVNPDYVRLVVSYGGVVVSGNVNSPMPKWSYEVGGPLNEQQIEAVVALVESWAAEAGEAPVEEVPNTVEAGAQVFATAGCVSCHGAELEGTAAGPNIQAIGAGLVDLSGFTQPSGLEQMEADYAADPREFLRNWIRDSSTNYNDGAATGMPPHPEGQLTESQLEALITFLLEQTGQ
jgi:mono/diheme cytochrome c family protein